MLLAGLGSCAAPVAGLWPAERGHEVYRVLVSVDSWHSVIGVWPQSDPRGNDPGGMREWGYADRNFFLDGNDRASGSIAALLWPTEGVLEISHGPVPYHRRSPQHPARFFDFDLSEAGHRRLLAVLRG
jgi:hypothetical protein